MHSLITSIVVVAALAGCGSIRPARMTLPPGLEAESERVVITGLGAAPRGQFQAGTASGTFSRSGSRLAVFDALYEAEGAVASFSLIGKDAIAARCTMKRRTANAGALTVEFKPMTYSCSFDGGPRPAELNLREARSTSRLQPMLRQRSGEMTLGDVRLQLRSSHALNGSTLPSAAPIGYVFERDTRVVAAVEINGTEPAILSAAASADGERQAVLLAALALALLWDPKETGLSD